MMNVYQTFDGVILVMTSKIILPAQLSAPDLMHASTLGRAEKWVDPYS